MSDDPRVAAARVGVPVWDILVRVFHWSLVADFAFAWISGEEWEDAHVIPGLIASRSSGASSAHATHVSPIS